MTAYGKVAWGSSSRNSGPNRDNVLTLADGHNRIRIVTEPFRFFTHKKSFPGDTSQWGRNIRCATENCPLCAESAAKERYVVGVIDRKSGTYKLLELGTQVYIALNTFRQVPDMSDLRAYDVIIVRNPKAGPQNFYQVIPGQLSPLTAEELALVESIKEEELEAYCKPPTPVEVEQSIARITNYIARQKEKEAKESGQPMPMPAQAVAAAAGKGKTPPAKASAFASAAEVTDDMLDFKEKSK